MVVVDREWQRADVLLSGGRPDSLLLRRGAPARTEMLHHLRYHEVPTSVISPQPKTSTKFFIVIATKFSMRIATIIEL